MRPTVSVRSVAAPRPYLDPTQRILRSEQIDLPRDHKNVYHVGVLDGGWVEERTAMEQRHSSLPFQGETEMSSSFRPQDTQGARRQPFVAGGMDPHLMFGHGKDLHSTNFVSSNELFYPNPGQQESMRVETVIAAEGNSGRRSLAAQKREQWKRECEPGDQFITVKAETFDATGTGPACAKARDVQGCAGV